MNELIKLDLENDIIIVRHWFKNEYSQIRKYKFSEIIQNPNANFEIISSTEI